jgi:acyl carrier protein
VHVRDPVRAASANSLACNSSETPQRGESLEKLVAELWRRILGVPSNHMREDFFDAGGDSLLAVRLMSQLCRHLDRELPVALFFKDPTVAGLVNGLMENNSGGELDYAIVKLADGVDGRVLFLSAGREDLDELAAAMRPGPSIYRLDAYFLQEQRLLAGQPMLDSVEAIAMEFRYRLKAIQPKGPYLLAGGCEDGVNFTSWRFSFSREATRLPSSACWIRLSRLGSRLFTSDPLLFIPDPAGQTPISRFYLATSIPSEHARV